MLDIQSNQMSHIKLNEMLSSLLNAYKGHTYCILSDADSQRWSRPQEQGPYRGRQLLENAKILASAYRYKLACRVFSEGQ